ncbi:integrator complex subunit 9 homolog [Xenia sp. Carnegie-2017]|uniref:integrator complex subunit 9 homolog n=1 Tax=Xenia sp. Carnegie-2017 TaxID=2897299 RepID=UPI001F04EBA4|nr:integrator complex subunit 9 homolog [Xenia sp. Carnegie-2017]
MKLYALGRNCKAPCYVLKFKQTTIMLDCSLDMLPSLNFTPLHLVEKKQGQSFSKPWFARELHDFDGFVDENNIREIAGNVFVDSEPEVLPPELDLLDLSTVDVILISNCFFMFALPYITEHTNFSGTVYATEPTSQMGRLVEIVCFIQSAKIGQWHFLEKT